MGLINASFIHSINRSSLFISGLFPITIRYTRKSNSNHPIHETSQKFVSFVDSYPNFFLKNNAATNVKAIPSTTSITRFGHNTSSPIPCRNMPRVMMA